MDKCLLCDSRPCQCAELFNEIAGEDDLETWREIIQPHLAEDPRARTDETEEFIDLIEASREET